MQGKWMICILLHAVWPCRCASAKILRRGPSTWAALIGSIVCRWGDLLQGQNFAPSHCVSIVARFAASLPVVYMRDVCVHFLSWREIMASHEKMGIAWSSYMCLLWMCLSWCWIRQQFIRTFANYVTVWMEIVRVQRKMRYGSSAYRAHMTELEYPAADRWSHAVWHLTLSWNPSAMGYSTEGLATSRRAEQKFGFDSPLDISMDRCDFRLIILANYVCMTSWTLHWKDMTLVW